MAEARCDDCDNTWETDEPGEDLDEAPPCPACGSEAVDVETSGGWFMVWR